MSGYAGSVYALVPTILDRQQISDALDDAWAHKFDVASILLSATAFRKTAVAAEVAAGVVSRVATAAEANVMPRVFKLLTRDGTSPYAPELAWSLPVLSKGGTWSPGAWQEAAHSTSVEKVVDYLGSKQRGLFATSHPSYWMHRADGERRIFEAELDPQSAALWERHHSVDFAAKRMRLIRELKPEDIAAFEQKAGSMHVPSYLGKDIRYATLTNDASPYTVPTTSVVKLPEWARRDVLATGSPRDQFFRTRADGHLEISAGRPSFNGYLVLRAAPHTVPPRVAAF